MAMHQQVGRMPFLGIGLGRPRGSAADGVRGERFGGRTRALGVAVWVAVGVAVGVALLAGGSDVGAQEPGRPAVGVRFEITAEGFLEGLGERRAAVEADVARRVADHCAAELSYVRWLALTNPPAAGDPPWILLGTMRSQGSSDIPAVVLVFEKRGPGQVSLELLREALYPANVPDQPTQESGRLLDELLDKVRRVFGNSDNLQRVQARFLAGIPIATRLEANPDLERVLLPARWAELLPGDGSQLRAQYEARRAGGARIPVKLQLSPSVPLGERVACAVTLFDYPPVTERSWHAAMPESLSNAVPETVRVFMLEYVKDYNFTPTTANGLVLDPFGDAGGGGAP